MNEIKTVSDSDLKTNWKVQIEKFITHYVWHSQDPVTNDKIKHGQRYQTPYWVRLQGRLNEMQERRRRLIKYLYKKEGKLNEFETGFQNSIAKKSTIIKKFSSIQLEDLLRTSTKNVAQEVVSSLIPPQGGLGVLADVQQCDSIVRKKPDTDSNSLMGDDVGRQAHSSSANVARRNQNLSNSQPRTSTAGSNAAGMGLINGEGDLHGEIVQVGNRQTKTATSGSRAQKSQTSYSLSAQQRAPTGNREQTDHLDDNVLTQMAINRQQNMSGQSKRIGNPTHT